MDRPLDHARESPGRGARAAESDSLLTRVSWSASFRTVQSVRSYLDFVLIDRLSLAGSVRVYGQDYGQTSRRQHVPELMYGVRERGARVRRRAPEPFSSRSGT